MGINHSISFQLAIGCGATWDNQILPVRWGCIAVCGVKKEILLLSLDLEKRLFMLGFVNEISLLSVGLESVSMK